MKTYAIGDVHGRADLLATLLAQIERENSSDPNGHRVIFLGDIIDRGPDSRLAMDLVVEELKQRSSSRLILGNHEEFLLLFLDRPDKREIIFDHWMRNGGNAAASSYGLDIMRPYRQIEDAHQMLVDLLNANPEHLEAMRAAAAFVRDDDHLFVHAGLRPGIEIEKQSTKDLRTIRADFLGSNFDFGPIVVHGHTVTTSRWPEIYGNRIALDTGAETTGRLTALEISEGEVESFLWTTQDGVLGVERGRPSDYLASPRRSAPARRFV
ncbi:metallophosphoesterase [Sinorhizobium meliloti]|uniref:metallophosphoesterase n=1 Tax=Rhizobium meliloti TaxID=382 RepID=UPI000FD84A53|nr:metallophosphoesterase [Sinorhizobium meliloti]RVP99662.1 serine/threonine protein phosphatase [Sinorhizobium meliloti]